ncbi:MAG: hypothetical protein KGH55_02570 [Nanoarchaeota archaeon]|nr:hypothetical protein [Nanoarchaeota archaeon]
MGDYNIENIYGGGYSSLDSEKAGGFVGYRIPSGKLGIATDPRTANILADVSQKLQSGAKQIEVSSIQPDVFESIPNQQIKEVQRLSKLTGVDVSLHGILVDPSGFTQQGYNELAREESERQMLSNVIRGHELNPDGNIPVTFHASQGWGGIEYKRTKTGVEEMRIPIVNQETGQVTLVQTETEHLPGMSAAELEKGTSVSAREHVKVRNDTEWKTSISNLVAIKERADSIIRETEPIATIAMEKMHGGANLTPVEREAYMRHYNAGLELHEIHKHLNGLFDKAYKYGEGEIRTEGGNRKYQDVLVQISENFGKSLKDARSLSDQSDVMGQLMQNLDALQSPEVHKPFEDFAIDKSATTFANVALGAYKKFHDKAPIISIENPPAGGGISTAEDLKRLVEASRKKFVDIAVEKEGMSRGAAEEQAKKLIGVTWDVGHINMLRKYGYTEEDIIKQSEKIAPLVKHVHLSDNFGFEHTELPMGMGNVPINKIMQKLGEKGFEARKVIEAGNWWQHFKTSPLPESLEAFGSPVYGMKMAPYWNQSISTQGYFSGYGMMLPQVNYETFGSGFSMLPQELGGQRNNNGRSRMGGNALE